jgi:N-acetylmuramoyl-L-alanine amidase
MPRSRMSSPLRDSPRHRTIPPRASAQSCKISGRSGQVVASGGFCERGAAGLRRWRRCCFRPRRGLACRPKAIRLRFQRSSWSAGFRSSSSAEVSIDARSLPMRSSSRCCTRARPAVVICASVPCLGGGCVRGAASSCSLRAALAYAQLLAKHAGDLAAARALLESLAERARTRPGVAHGCSARAYGAAAMLRMAAEAGPALSAHAIDAGTPNLTNGANLMARVPGHGIALRQIDVYGSGLSVVLTREPERAVSIEERSAIANAVDAELFVSIPLNASTSAADKGGCRLTCWTPTKTRKRCGSLRAKTVAVLCSGGCAHAGRAERVVMHHATRGSCRARDRRVS